MKTVRLRLNLIRALVEASDLNVRVLLLVRDPRASLESRKHQDWCPGHPDCEDPARLCQDLKSDYHAYKALSRQFPGRYQIVRHEDLISNPFIKIQKIFQSFGLRFSNPGGQFLETERAKSQNLSKTVKWRERMTKSEVLRIQVFRHF